MSKTHCEHRIETAPDEPFRVFTPEGNLLGIYPTEETAREQARLNRVRQLTQELWNITNMPEWRRPT